MFTFDFYYDSDDEKPLHSVKAERVSQAKKKIETALEDPKIDWDNFDMIGVKEVLTPTPNAQEEMEDATRKV